MRGHAVSVFVLLLLGVAPAAHAVDMIGSTGGSGGGTPNPGTVLSIDQTNGSSVILDTPFGGNGVAGLATNAAGRVFGSTSVVTPLAGIPHLIEIDPVTGALIADIGPILDVTGTDACPIGDLSFQPGTDILFGVASSNTGNCGLGTDSGGLIVTIDITTAQWTAVGRDPSFTNNSGGLAFAPDGTLYFSGAWESPGILHTLDPATGNILTAQAMGSGAGYLGLAVRPTDGVIFASERWFVANGIWTIDPNTGVETFIGDPGELVHDLTFVGAAAVPAQSTGSLLLMGLMLALILAGATTATVRIRRSTG